MTSSDVVAARAGDREAFARLVRASVARVCRITTSILGDPIAAEDVGQDVFVAAWQRLPTLRQPSRFGAWLDQIARYRAYDVRRKQRPVDVLGEVEPAGPAPDVVAWLDDARDEAALWAAVAEVDGPHREVLELYYRDGHSVAEIASRLAMEEPTVRKRLSRGRQRLRQEMADRLGHRRVAVGVGVAIAGIAPRMSWAAVGLGAGALAVAGLVVSLASPVSPRPEVAVGLPSASGVVEHEVAPVVTPSVTGWPDVVVHAFLAAEDARFFAHGGVDEIATTRAVWNTLSGARQGGSTITQQLAKRQLQQEGWSGVSRKVAEVFRARELEAAHPKEEILDQYLSGVYLGQGATGVVEAARRYFDKPVSELTVGEAAMLAGLAAAPSRDNPVENPVGAAERQAYVLRRMAAHGWAP